MGHGIAGEQLARRYQHTASYNDDPFVEYRANEVIELTEAYVS